MSAANTPATAATEQPAATPAVPATTTPAPAVEEGRKFDQTEVDKIVQTRLARAEKDVEARLEATRKEAEERAKMDETQKYKADLDKATARTAELEARAVTAERKAELTGKVADVNLALKVAEAKHFLEDGTLNGETLFADYPILKPADTSVLAITPSKPAPTPAANPGGKSVAQSPQAALARGDVAGYIAALETAKKG